MTDFNAAAVTHVLSTAGEIIIASKRIRLSWFNAGWMLAALLFACASKQHDAEQERNNEGDRRDPNNEPGIGVPWCGKRARIGKVQTSNH